jgi:sterol carrier protein 2
LSTFKGCVFQQVPEVAPEGEAKTGKTPYALQHNLGLGGACVVTVLKRPHFWKSGGRDGRDRFGYNHGCECKEPTKADLEKSVLPSFYLFGRRKLNGS